MKQIELIDSLPEWVPHEAFQEFMEMRKKIRKPMTPYAVQLAIKLLWKLKEEGNDPLAVLEQSILRSWQSLYAVKKESQPTFKGVK